MIWPNLMEEDISLESSGTDGVPPCVVPLQTHPGCSMSKPTSSGQARKAPPQPKTHDASKHPREALRRKKAWPWQWPFRCRNLLSEGRGQANKMRKPFRVLGRARQGLTASPT
jgi:hypothetical protein